VKYEDRKDAATRLIPELQKYEGSKNALILAIPRGALEIGAILRDQLKIPLDIIVTKKIGAPGNEEFAIGVVDPEGQTAYDEKILKNYGIPLSYIEDEAKRLTHVIKRRYEAYRGSERPPDVNGKTCIIVDDGMATGRTVEAAITYLKRQKAGKVVLAVPVSAIEAASRLEKEVDEFICLQRPEDFYAVGQFYRHFPQVTDEEAIRILSNNTQQTT